MKFFFLVILVSNISISLSNDYDSVFDDKPRYYGIRAVEYPKDGVNLGVGWNSYNGLKTFASCVDYEVSQSGGQSATLSVKRVDESDSLRRELNTSYSATAKAKFKIGSGSVDAKVDLIRKSKVENHSLNVLVKANIVNGVSFTTPPKEVINKVENVTIRLNQFGRVKLAESIEEFYKHCGDSFVSSIERGSELYAVYNYRERKSGETEQKKGSFSVGGSYMAFEGSLSYNTDKLEQIIKASKLSNINYYHSAHRGLLLPHDEESVYETLRYLGSSLAPEDSYPFRVYLTHYSELPDFVGQLPDDVVINHAREAYRIRLMGLVSRLDHVLKDNNLKDNYGGDNRGESKQFYRDLQDRLQAELIKVEDETKDCLAQNNGFEIFNKNSTCAMKNDGKYSDYLFRAQMPVNDNFRRDKTDQEINSEEKIIEKIDALQKSYNNTTVNVYKKAKKCGGIFKGGFCGYDYINEGCSIHPSHSFCVNTRAKINNEQVKLASFRNKLDKLIDADSRFLYWIDETSRERREYNEPNGYLTNQELDAYKRQIYCQYVDLSDLPINGNMAIISTDENNPASCDVNVSKTANENKSYRYVYKFNLEKHKERQKKLKESLLSNIARTKELREGMVSNYIQNKINLNHGDNPADKLKSKISVPPELRSLFLSESRVDELSAFKNALNSTSNKETNEPCIRVKSVLPDLPDTVCKTYRELEAEARSQEEYMQHSENIKEFEMSFQVHEAKITIFDDFVKLSNKTLDVDSPYLGSKVDVRPRDFEQYMGEKLNTLTRKSKNTYNTEEIDVFMAESNRLLTPGVVEDIQNNETYFNYWVPDEPFISLEGDFDLVLEEYDQ